VFPGRPLSRTVAPYAQPPGQASRTTNGPPSNFIPDTNAIESLNARFRQATRRRGHFPDEQAALKVHYLVITTPHKNRPNVTGSTPGRKTALNALTMYYGDRINPN
jgi:transposase-like protein